MIYLGLYALPDTQHAACMICLQRCITTLVQLRGGCLYHTPHTPAVWDVLLAYATKARGISCLIYQQGRPGIKHCSHQHIARKNVALSVAITPDTLHEAQLRLERWADTSRIPRSPAR